VTSYVHDAKGLLLQKIIDPSTSTYTGLNLITTIAYNAEGKKIKESRGNAANSTLWTERYEYDPLGRLSKTIIDSGGLNLTTSIRYNAANQKIAEVDVNGSTTRYFYDAAGHLRFTVNQKGGVTELAYDAANHLVMQRNYLNPMDVSQLNDNTTLLEVEALAKAIAASTDEIKTVFYDEQGRIQFTVNNMGAVIAHVYDAASREIATTRYATQITPSSVSTLTTAELQRLMASKITANDETTYHILDAAGQACFSINPDGFITERYFDALGHVITTTQYANAVSDPAAVAKLPVDKVLSQITRDPLRDQTTIQVFDALNRLTYCVNAERQVTFYEYDADGNRTLECRFLTPITVPATYETLVILLETLTPNPKTDYVVRTTYDNNHRVLTTTNPLGQTDSRRYDALGNVVGRTDTLVNHGFINTMPIIENGLKSV